MTGIADDDATELIYKLSEDLSSLSLILIRARPFVPQ